MGHGMEAWLSLQCPNVLVIDAKVLRSAGRLGAFYIYSPFFPQRTTERYNQPRNFRQEQPTSAQLLPRTPLTRNNVSSHFYCCFRLSAPAQQQRFLPAVLHSRGLSRKQKNC